MMKNHLHELNKNMYQPNSIAMIFIVRPPPILHLFIAESSVVRSGTFLPLTIESHFEQ